MAVKCAAIARSGSRCASPVLPGSSYCWVHDPAAEEARREASKKGGRARSNQERARKQIPPAMPPDELGGYLSALFKAVVAGRVEPKVGTAAATIARVMLEVRAQVEIEERLARLEAAAGVEKGRTA